MRGHLLRTLAVFVLEPILYALAFLAAVLIFFWLVGSLEASPAEFLRRFHLCT